MTETPDYKVISTDGKFEIRDYPALTVATTRMEGGEMNGGFGKLFRFITGSNDAKEKIAMTAPVLIDTTKDKKTMSIIMPKAAVEKGVPKPAGDSVTLGRVEAARFAVLRFDGGRTAENEKVASKNSRDGSTGRRWRAKALRFLPTMIHRGHRFSCAVTKC